MRRGNIALMLVGAAVGLIVLALTQSRPTEEPAPVVVQQEAPEVEITRVLVAAREIPAGRLLTEDDYHWEPWPIAALPRAIIDETAITDEELLEARLRNAVLFGEPILTSNMVLPGDAHGFLAASLAPGMRAVSIPVSVKNSVGGFVRPGDLVDVLMTYEVRLDRDLGDRSAARSVISRYASETVLERIRVLAVDQQVSSDRDASPARTVTIEVSEKQAQKISLALSIGELSLALRSVLPDPDEIADVAGKPAFGDVAPSTLLVGAGVGGFDLNQGFVSAGEGVGSFTTDMELAVALRTVMGLVLGQSDAQQGGDRQSRGVRVYLGGNVHNVE